MPVLDRSLGLPESCPSRDHGLPGNTIVENRTRTRARMWRPDAGIWIWNCGAMEAWQALFDSTMQVATQIYDDRSGSTTIMVNAVVPI